MPNEIHQRHDKFFKKNFKDVNIARDYITNFLPPEIVKNLDLSTLELVPNDFISESFRKFYTDVLYRCKYKGQHIYISLIFEHKSKPPDYPHIQLLAYALEIWQDQIQNKKPLTPVFPMLLYHGKENWELKPMEDYFPIMDDFLKKFNPLFDIHFVSTKDWSDEAIQALKAQELINVLLALKHVFDPPFIEAHFELFFVTSSPTSLSGNLIKRIFVYLTNNISVTKEKIEIMSTKLNEPIKEKVLSTYEQIVRSGWLKGEQEGWRKGEQEGEEKKAIRVIKNLYKRGFPVGEIAEVVEKSEAFVLEVLQKEGLS